MKGGDTTKPPFSYYTDRMWMFFLPRQQRNERSGTWQTVFRDDIERENYELCQQVWDGLTGQEREILTLVYCANGESTAQAVRKYAEANAMREQSVWNIAHQISKELAIRKRLLPEKKGGYYHGAD